MPRSRSLLALAASLLLAQATAQTCYSGVNIFTARGTGETPGVYGLSGVYISAIENAIPGSGATILDYPAQFTATSVPIGVNNSNADIAAYLDACPDSQIVIMGYSQGAFVQGLVLTGANFTIGPDGSTPYNALPLAEKYVNQVIAVVFFGDPGYNNNVGENPIEPYPCVTNSSAPRTSEIWKSLSPRVQEFCDSTDEYCCSGPNLSFAGHVAYFNSGNTTLAAEFVAQRYSSSSASSTSTTSTVTSQPIETITPTPISTSTSVSSSISTTSSTIVTITAPPGTSTSTSQTATSTKPGFAFPTFTIPGFTLGPFAIPSIVL